MISRRTLGWQMHSLPHMLSFVLSWLVGALQTLPAQQLPAVGEALNIVPRPIYVADRAKGLAWPIDAVVGSLTRDGESLLTQQGNGQLVAYQLSDTKRRVVNAPIRVLTAWVDSQTGGVFVLAYSNERAHLKPVPPAEPVDLRYFESLEQLLKWEISWTQNKLTLRQGGIHWVPGADVFALFHYRHELFKNKRNKEQITDITLLTRAGQVLSQHSVPGSLIGVDQGEWGPEAFVVRTQGSVHLGVADLDTAEPQVETIADLPYLPLQDAMTHYPIMFGRWNAGTRFIRLGRLEPGDVRQFATESIRDPGFFFVPRHGLCPLGRRLSSLPRGNLRTHPRSRRP
ncbi:MAG: hypothetical protein R3C53_01505 [Pirellulaceae bacterium]